MAFQRVWLSAPLVLTEALSAVGATRAGALAGLTPCAAEDDPGLATEALVEASLLQLEEL